MSTLVHERQPVETLTRELEAILMISRTAAEGSLAADTLEEIAASAVHLMGASAATIVVRSADSESGLAVAAEYNVGQEFVDFLNRIEPLEVGAGISGTAVALGAPVRVNDVATDPLMEPWRKITLEAGYRSIVSIPLCPAEGSVIGVLNVYRDRAGSWSGHDVRLLCGLADHAAIAIRISRLLEESRRQVESLSMMVHSLRSQAHEHSNRLHAIHGLLWLEEFDKAKRLLTEIEEGHHTSYGRVTARIHNAALAGFLISERATASQSGIDVRIDQRSRLDELPPGLSDLDAITLVGNLLQNAVDAVAACTTRRRQRVSVAILQQSSHLVIRVRDWGPGATDAVLGEMLRNGFSSKAGHPGIGMAMVAGIVQASNGTIEVTRPSGDGLVVTVRIPR